MNAIPGRDYLGTSLPRKPLSGIQLAAYYDQANVLEHPGIITVSDHPSDTTVDVFEYAPERVALSDVAPWAKAARQNYDEATSPGQRRPAILVERELATDIVNELIAGGVTSLDLWISAPCKASDAEKMVEESGGPFPTIGYRFAHYSDSPYSVDFFSAEWLRATSGPLIGGESGAVIPAPHTIRVLSTSITIEVDGEELEFTYTTDD